MLATKSATIARRNASKTIARRAPRNALADAPPRQDVYAEVTATIIRQLEAGRLPWVQPWAANASTGSMMPHNASTGRAYSGVNVLLLWSAQMEAGYSSAAWMTFNQARELGGCVRKGSKGRMIVYADRFTPASEKERAVKEGDEAQSRFFLKRHTVFNVAQIDGLPDRFSVEPELVGERQQIEAAERLIEASGVEFRIGGDKAYYVPALDFVQVPDQRRFADQVNFYRTVCHELCHATGHKSRLDRNLLTIDGLKDRAREELVAEMGSAFVCASLTIVPTVRHADYIGSWLEVLKNDNRAIFKAASAASKAADWLLSRVEG